MCCKGLHCNQTLIHASHYFFTFNSGNVKSFASKVYKAEDKISLAEIFEDGPPTSYFQVKNEALPLLREFRDEDMATSNIFQYAWGKNLISAFDNRTVDGLDDFNPLLQENFIGKCFEELSGDLGDDFYPPELPMHLNGIIAFILLPSLNHTHRIMHQLISGDIKITDALPFTRLCQIEQELEKLNSFFKDSFNANEINECADKLRCVSDMKSCTEQSFAIKKSALALDLRGDFNSILKITRKV